MNRCALLVILLAFPFLAAAQTSTSSHPLQTIIVPAPGAPSTNTGTAVIIAPPSAPLMVTPEVHLTTVAPSVGASNATAGNSAGAVNATAGVPVPPRSITTVPLYAGAGATVTTPSPEQTSGAPATFNTGAGASGTAGPPLFVMNNGTLFDRGVGSGNAVIAGDSTGAKTLGEMAREIRQHDASANARVYTNDDIQRINRQPGLQVGGMAGATVDAGSETGTQPQPVGNAPAVAQPSTTPRSNPGQAPAASPGLRLNRPRAAGRQPPPAAAITFVAHAPSRVYGGSAGL